MTQVQNWKDKAAALAKENDHVTAVEFETYLAPEGTTVARLVEIVEYGNQKTEYKGTIKFKPMIKLGFELLGKNYLRVDKDGVKVPNILRTPMMPISSDPKAGFKKLLLSMAGTNKSITSMYELLFEPFKIKIVHNQSKDGKKTYANMKDESGWTVKPAMWEDPNDDMKLKPLECPEASWSEPLMFCFTNPDKVEWDKLFIEGTRDDGTSKNFIQQQIVSANNFDGSCLQMMLQNMNIEIDAVAVDEDIDTDDEHVEEKPKTKVAKAKTATKTKELLQELPKVPDASEATDETPVDDMPPEVKAYMIANGFIK